MRLIHSSDWHLGHSLHGSDRESEHRAFLAWLLDRIQEEHVEGMILAGDLFDSANPPVSALRLWFEFLRDLDRRAPGFQLVLVGGNHDSASRIEAPRELIRHFGVHVVGGLPRRADGALDMDRILLPIQRPGSEASILVAALPFLRMADLPRGEQGGLDPVEGVRSVYAEVLAEASRRRKPGQRLIVTGHCYMVAGKISDLSERKILGGDQHALPLDIFEGDVDYVALGHLHLAQRVGDRNMVRYCGSPIPLSLSEKDYPHQVLLLDLAGEADVEVRSLLVPRHREILRIPERDAGPLDQVLAELSALPESTEDSVPDEHPMLEVRVRLEGPEPGLRRRIEDVLAGHPLPDTAVAASCNSDNVIGDGCTDGSGASLEEGALEDAEKDAEPPAKPKRKRRKKVVPRPKRARLVKLTIERTGTATALGEEVTVSELRELEIEEVFRKRYAQVHQGEVEPRLLETFRELQSLEFEEGAE